MKKNKFIRRTLIIVLTFTLASLSNFLKIDKSLYASNKIIDVYEQEEVIEEISKIAMLEEIVIRNFKYSYKNVQSLDEKCIGYVIDFNYDGGFGYSIFYKINEKMILIELFFDRNSPYYKINGIPIYFSLGQYYIKRGNNIYKIDNLKNKANLDDYLDQHVLTAYGFKEYQLSRTSVRKVWSPTWFNPFRHIDEYYTESHHEKFLKVADGWNGTCYYNYSRSNTFSNAAINIYE